MTFATLIRANLFRKPIRGILLILSVSIAFLIYCLLQSFAAGFGGTDDTANRLVVTSKISTGETLPLRLLDDIERVKGVEAVSYVTRLRAYYRDPRNILGVSAVDPQRSARTFRNDIAMTPDLLQAIGDNKSGALVGRTLADNQGWQVGQHITITSMAYRQLNGDSKWDFEIVGIFDGLRPTVDANFMVVRYDYFNDARANGRDTVGGFSVLPRDPAQADDIAHAIDAMFANSGSETRTRTEIEFLKAFTEQLADIQTIMALVIGAAFVTLLMIVVNTMVFAIRERTAEIGILKTLGMSRRAILAIILAETQAISFTGGLIGLGLAYGVVAFIGGEVGLVFTPGIALTALGLMGLIGVVTGAIPALRAMRLPIVAAFQQR